MEETIDQKPTLLSTAVKDGVLLGIIHIVVYLVLYFILPEYLTGFIYLGFIIVLNIGFCMFKGIQYRNEVGGYLGFGGAFKYCLLVLVVNGLLSSLLIPILFSLIDSNYGVTLAQSQVDTSVYWAEKFGADETAIDQMREKMDVDELAKRYSFTGILTGYGVALIFYALGSTIASFAVRKSEPEIM